MSKVFVGNLDFGATRQNLEELFAPIGEIADIVLPMDRETGRPRGFAFVTYASAESAAEAIRRLDGTELLGRRMRVSEATPRPERRPGGPPERRGGPGGERRGGPPERDFNRGGGGDRGRGPTRGYAPPSPPPPEDFPFERDGFVKTKGSRRGLRGRKRSL